MNTEQLRKEFEAWFGSAETHLYMDKKQLGRASYSAAAQSRDELIGRFYKALSIAQHSGVARALSAEVLLEAEALGYGEKND